MNQSVAPYKSILLLVFLTWLNVLNFADRTLLGLLAKQIDEDPGINVSYEMVGFLTGYGFIIFYTLIGVAMGTLADRWHRPRLMAAGLAIWSTLTAATGIARNFWQMAACRAFIGVGEAALTPSALSMLGDRFPLRLRAFASGTYYAGIPLGAGIGMIVSAYLLPHYGWRGCFTILGLLGVVFVVPLLFVRDSARHSKRLSESADDVAHTPPRFKDVVLPLLRTVRTSPALVCTIAGAVFAVYAQSSSIFVLTWLQNDRGMEYAYAAKLGGWLYLIGGTLGSIWGGLLGDWFGRVIPSGGRLWFLALVNLIFTPISLAFYLGDVQAWYFKVIWITSAFGSMVWYGALFSAVTELSPARSRATAIAFLIFCMNLLGAGPGPWVTGWLGGNFQEWAKAHPEFRDSISPMLDMLGVSVHHSFTIALLASVVVGFFSLPFNVIAALRYEKDAAKVRD